MLSSRIGHHKTNKFYNLSMDFEKEPKNQLKQSNYISKQPSEVALN